MFIFAVEEKEESSDSHDELLPKPKKRKSKLQLIPCKIEMNTVKLPPAMQQRNIQLEALQSSPIPKSGDLLTPQPIETVHTNLKHRKKTATIVDDVSQLSSTNTTSTSDEDSGTEDGVFETYLVIEFSPNIAKSTLHWIIDKMRMKISKGGAGLLLKREPQTE